MVAGTDYTGHFHPQEIQEAKALSVVGYLGILFLVPLLAQPNNRFARFHANQGLVLALFWFALSIARIIIDDVPVIGWFSWILWFVPFVLMILGMIAAGSGRAKTLPLVGNFQLIK